MPIYEFYCEECHMLFNFFSPSIDTEARPDCPRCGLEELERRPARFAMVESLGSSEEPEDELFAGLDEERLEAAMGSMMGELEGMENEEDPRVMAKFFRRFGEAAGMKLGPRMEEMLQRLESGEDLDALEEEMGDELGDDGEALEEWFQLKEKARGLSRLAKKPRVDDELYFL
ncbi:MAG: FmdB family zinc ribbon protein [Thermoanaerobaculia bacterium]|nr:FmdB family zinc ribbon protein [Thermoanaerobaculia bacterium]